MKIRDYHKPSIHDLSKSEKEGRATDTSIKPKFAEELTKVHKNIVREKLDLLLKEVNDQAKKLVDGYDIKDLLKYKDLVKRFLNEALEKMYKVKEEMGWDRRGRHKVYTIVETVDKELEQLTDLFMAEQKDNIAILKKMDEIKGMLLDIYS